MGYRMNHSVGNPGLWDHMYLLLITEGSPAGDAGLIGRSLGFDAISHSHRLPVAPHFRDHFRYLRQQLFDIYHFYRSNKIT